jgi:hypothetical protein
LVIGIICGWPLCAVADGVVTVVTNIENRQRTEVEIDLIPLGVESHETSTLCDTSFDLLISQSRIIPLPLCIVDGLKISDSNSLACLNFLEISG